MKKSTIFFSFLFTSSLLSFGQKHHTINIVKPKEKPELKSMTSASGAIYIGIPNTLVLTDTILTANKYILQTTANIEISRSGNKITINPRSTDNHGIVIFIRKLQGKDTITLNIQKFGVGLVPDPIPAINGKPVNGTISKSELLKYKKLTVYESADIINSNTWYKCISFDMDIDNNEFHSNSDTLTNSMLQAIQMAQYGTSISINITGLDLDSGTRNLGGSFLLVK